MFNDKGHLLRKDHSSSINKNRFLWIKKNVILHIDFEACKIKIRAKGSRGSMTVRTGVGYFTEMIIMQLIWNLLLGSRAALEMRLPDFFLPACLPSLPAARSASELKAPPLVLEPLSLCKSLVHFMPRGPTDTCAYQTPAASPNFSPEPGDHCSWSLDHTMSKREILLCCLGGALYHTFYFMCIFPINMFLLIPSALRRKGLLSGSFSFPSMCRSQHSAFPVEGAKRGQFIEGSWGKAPLFKISYGKSILHLRKSHLIP